MDERTSRLWPLDESSTITASSEADPSGRAARSSARGVDDVLGEALSIKHVAALIGCSPWTVRQVLIPRGLPCFRAGANGRLIFYRQQVVQWVLRQQQHRKGRP